MKIFSISMMIISATLRVCAQDISVSDTVIVEPIIAADSLLPIIMPATDYEYVPADETPALIADRLSCLQGKIELTYNEKVHAFINYFTIRDREYTRMVQRRKDMYFPLFEKYLAKYNLPDELKYLSIIESGLNPRATSHARAVGLWQFMAGTGKYFGLYRDWYIDERMDPEKSTDAACRYLSQLYSLFGNWQLALAAYNSGPGTVRKAIRRSGYKKTFWEVYPHLPRETRSYVPQFIAIIYAMNHAEDHNLLELAREEMLPNDTVLVKQYLHFETFAKLTGTCVEDLQKLNPSIQRNALPDNGREHIFRIPIHSKFNLQQNRISILDSASKVGKSDLELLARKTAGSTYGRELVVYRVKSGDVLGLIAQRNGVRTDDIRKWNNLSSNMIRAGQRLNLWIVPPSYAARTKAELTIAPGAKTYIVQPGDTLWDISKKLPGVSVEKIKNLNNLKSSKLQPGQKLIIG